MPIFIAGTAAIMPPTKRSADRNEDARSARQIPARQIRSSCDQNSEILRCKRRKITPFSQVVEGETSSIQSESVTIAKPVIVDWSSIVTCLYRFGIGICNVNLTEVRDALNHVIELTLMSDKDELLRKFVKADGVAIVSKCLTFRADPVIQWKAAKFLADLPGKGFPDQIVEAGLMETLLSVMKHANDELEGEVILCLGNVARSNKEWREDLVASNDFLERLFHLISNPQNEYIVYSTTNAFVGLCRHLPKPLPLSFRRFITPLLIICKFSLNPDPGFEIDPEVNVPVDALWALSYLLERDHINLKVFRHAGGLQLVKDILLNHFEFEDLVPPAVRCIANVAAGNAEETDVIVKEGFLDFASALFKHRLTVVRFETAWMLQNILIEGSGYYIDIIIANKLLPQIKQMSLRDRWKIRVELMWVLSNFVLLANVRQLNVFSDDGCIESLSKGLHEYARESDLTLRALKAVEKLLLVDEESNSGFYETFCQYGGLDNLHALEDHSNPEISEMANTIIERFIEDEQEDSDQNIESSPDRSQTDLLCKTLFTTTHETQAPADWVASSPSLSTLFTATHETQAPADWVASPSLSLGRESNNMGPSRPNSKTAGFPLK